MADSGDDASFLVVLLDASVAGWEALGQLAGLGPQCYVEQVLVFLNMYAALNHDNRLAVFAVGASTCHQLHISSNCGLQPSSRGAAARDSAPAAAVLAGLQLALGREAEAASAGGGGRQPALSGGLARALCVINRMQKQHEEGGGRRSQQHPRVLCLQVAPDAPTQYIAVMKGIFAAQRLEVLVDGCKLGHEHSSFLQQAAHLTGGTYLRPGRPAALLQYLLSVFAVDSFTRKYLRLPNPSDVDLRAMCFCHKRLIDTGYVCSACLSVFCEQVAACTTCGAEFEGRLVR